MPPLHDKHSDNYTIIFFFSQSPKFIFYASFYPAGIPVPLHKLHTNRGGTSLSAQQTFQDAMRLHCRGVPIKECRVLAFLQIPPDGYTADIKAVRVQSIRFMPTL